MTAPAPSPAEQAVIDRFGIFEAAVDVDALDKLREAATEHGANFPWRQDSGWGENLLGADGEQIGAVEWVTDAALVTAAVNALPDLLAEVRRGRALREAVEGLCSRAVTESERRVPGEPYRSPAVEVARLRAVVAAVDAS